MDFESLKKLSLVAEAVFNIYNISSLKTMRDCSDSLAHVRGFLEQVSSTLATSPGNFPALCWGCWHGWRTGQWPWRLLTF